MVQMAMTENRDTQGRDAVAPVEAQLRLVRKMEAMGQLSSSMAHDFNNTLQGIISSLELIRMRADSGRLETKDVRRLVGGALASASQAVATTRQLQAFSRRHPLDPRQVSVNPRLALMAGRLQQTLGERIRLDFELAGDLWPVWCDPCQFESAMLNLAANARDAMPQGGRLLIRSGNAAVQGPEDAGGQHVCIDVADEGSGMPAEVLEHAFEPFFTTRARRRGAGMGLPVVYGFARQSGGCCEICSEPGSGTSVKLYLPRHLAGVDDGGKRMPAPSAATPGNLHGKGGTVLLVEDEPVVRQLVANALQQLGYPVLEAASGEDGLALLQSNKAVSLLATDIGLPGMNGRELADAARQTRPDLKILLMTGYVSDMSVAGSMAADMALISKPFTTEALGQCLRTMIGEAVDQP